MGGRGGLERHQESENGHDNSNSLVVTQEMKLIDRNNTVIINLDQQSILISLLTSRIMICF